MNGHKTFSKNIERYVFERLKEIPNKNPKIWRVDLSGNYICYPSYGDYQSRFSWNIHHKNEIPLDNRLINLEGISYERHEKYHENKRLQ